MIKVAKDMLNIFRKNPNAYYNGELIKITDLSSLKSLTTLTTILDMRHKYYLLQLV